MAARVLELLHTLAVQDHAAAADGAASAARRLRREELRALQGWIQFGAPPAYVLCRFACPHPARSPGSCA